MTLITVGKTDVKWVREGLDLYKSRLTHYIQFNVVEIPELKNVSSLTREQIKAREGELLLAQIRPGDDVILMDEHGRQFRSVEFASMLQNKMACSGRDIVFIRILSRSVFACRFQDFAFRDDVFPSDGQSDFH